MTEEILSYNFIYQLTSKYTLPDLFSFIQTSENLPVAQFGTVVKKYPSFPTNLSSLTHDEDVFLQRAIYFSLDKKDVFIKQVTQIVVDGPRGANFFKLLSPIASEQDIMFVSEDEKRSFYRIRTSLSMDEISSRLSKTSGFTPTKKLGSSFVDKIVFTEKGKVGGFTISKHLEMIVGVSGEFREEKKLEIPEDVFQMLQIKPGSRQESNFEILFKVDMTSPPRGEEAKGKTDVPFIKYAFVDLLMNHELSFLINEFSKATKTKNYVVYIQRNDKGEIKGFQKFLLSYNLEKEKGGESSSRKFLTFHISLPSRSEISIFKKRATELVNQYKSRYRGIVDEYKKMGMDLRAERAIGLQKHIKKVYKKLEYYEKGLQRICLTNPEVISKDKYDDLREKKPNSVMKFKGKWYTCDHRPTHPTIVIQKRTQKPCCQLSLPRIEGTKGKIPSHLLLFFRLIDPSLPDLKVSSYKFEDDRYRLNTVISAINEATNNKYTKQLDDEPLETLAENIIEQISLIEALIGMNIFILSSSASRPVFVEPDWLVRMKHERCIFLVEYRSIPPDHPKQEQFLEYNDQVYYGLVKTTGGEKTFDTKTFENGYEQLTGKTFERVSMFRRKEDPQLADELKNVGSWISERQFPIITDPSPYLSTNILTSVPSSIPTVDQVSAMAVSKGLVISGKFKNKKGDIVGIELKSGEIVVCQGKDIFPQVPEIPNRRIIEPGTSRLELFRHNRRVAEVMLRCAFNAYLDRKEQEGKNIDSETIIQVDPSISYNLDKVRDTFEESQIPFYDPDESEVYVKDDRTKDRLVRSLKHLLFYNKLRFTSTGCFQHLSDWESSLSSSREEHKGEAIQDTETEIVDRMFFFNVSPASFNLVSPQLINSDVPYFIRNSKMEDGQIFLVQKGLTLNHALNISFLWNKYEYNSFAERMTEKRLVGMPKSFVLFQYSNAFEIEKKVISGSSASFSSQSPLYIAIMKQEDEVAFFALLPMKT